MKEIGYKEEHTIRIVVLGIVVFLLYANSFYNQFLLDDRTLILANPYIKSWKYLAKIFSTDLFFWDFISKHNFYRPLQTITYFFDHSIWHLNPFGYHLTNTLLHFANGIFHFCL